MPEAINQPNELMQKIVVMVALALDLLKVVESRLNVITVS